MKFSSQEKHVLRTWADDGRVLSPLGSLNAVCKRLAERKLLRVSPPPPGVRRCDDPAEVWYKITAAGRMATRQLLRPRAHAKEI